jgi:hypothetical protein
MPTLPRAQTTVTDTAGAVASGLDTICVFSPCPQAMTLRRACSETRGRVQQTGTVRRGPPPHAKRSTRNLSFSSGCQSIRPSAGTLWQDRHLVTTVSAGGDGARGDGEWL